MVAGVSLAKESGQGVNLAKGSSRSFGQLNLASMPPATPAFGTT